VRDIVASIESEFERYRRMGEGAFGQVTDGELDRPAEGNGNSMATLVQHVSGNFRSRFTDFLTSDGEKPWRDRESEFMARARSRQELRAAWDEGWKILRSALAGLSDDDLGRPVVIRGEPLAVREALHRSLSHLSYHVGQMVMLGRAIQGDHWRFLTIAPGKSAQYNRAPFMEKAPVAAAAVQDDIAERIVKAVTGPVWHGPSLGELLGDVTASEAAARPAAGLHTIAEIVLHVRFWCDDSLRRLPSAGAGAEALPEPGSDEDWPAFARPDEQGWRRAVAGLEESHRGLAGAVKLLSPDLLPARIPGRKVTCEDMLRGVVEHAAYHGGQIAILRRSLRG
jgi:uncharacterized damage-inducible protein DinB